VWLGTWVGRMMNAKCRMQNEVGHESARMDTNRRGLIDVCGGT